MLSAHPHQEMLTRANKVRAAASDRDIERLRREVLGLLDAFVEHSEAMGAAVAELPGAAAEALGRGQQLVLDRLHALSVAASSDEVGPRCGDLGRDLATLLTLHADTERRAIGHRATLTAGR